VIGRTVTRCHDHLPVTDCWPLFAEIIVTWNSKKTTLIPRLKNKEDEPHDEMEGHESNDW